MFTFGIFAWGILAGCALGLVLYTFFWETSVRQKVVIGVVYLLSWLVNAILRTEFPVGLLVQIALCIYFVFYFKTQEL